jgi:hypothetical protein
MVQSFDVSSIFLRLASLLTPQIRVLLEKLTVTQLGKKLQAFYGKVYYRVHNSPPLVPINSQLNPVQAFQPYLCKIRFNSLGLSSGHFLSGFPTKTPYSFLFSLIRATRSDHLTFLDFMTLLINIWWGVGYNYEAPHYEICPTLSLRLPSYAQISLSGPYYRKVSLYSSLRQIKFHTPI